MTINTTKEDVVKKKKDNKKKAKKKLDISMKAIVDNIVFSDTDQWAYYKISNTVFDFLSYDAKISVATQLTNAFINLMSDRQEPLDCHLLIVSNPVDIDAWEAQVRQISQNWNRAPGFDSYINKQVEHLKSEAFMKKVTYLGINIGKRGALNFDANNILEAGFNGAMETIGQWVKTALKTPDLEISQTEENEAKKKEIEFFRTLSTGNLQASRVTAEELLLVMKRQMWPAMETPYLDVDHESRIGPGDLDLELASSIHNNLRWLQFTQMYGAEERVGYRAALTIGKLPKHIEYPYTTIPFLYFMNQLGLPFPCYARFSLRPTNAMRKELEKKKKEQKDELENLEGAGDTLDSQMGALPSSVRDSLLDMQLLNDLLASNKAPWVEGVYRFVVEEQNEEDLKKTCAYLKQRFSDLDIHIQWTTGDQKDLFLEQMPGDKLRIGSHKQVTDLSYLGTSGFNFSGDVGDLTYEANDLNLNKK